MALISCPECGTQVSQKAHACVKCGHPIASQPTRVATAEDSFLTRNRGFGDVLIFGPAIGLIALLAIALFFTLFA
jgi:uncharacterized membrane protein YvbJ